LLNKRSDTVYQFHMLISGDFSKNIINSVDELLVKYGCPKANWIDMKKQYENVDMNLKHISYATYYRLQIPNILDDDKCIYLDVDVCVESYLSEYFNIDIENDYMAGVKAAAFYVPETNLVARAEKIKVAKYDRYINAGALLLNLKKLRENNMQEKFEECMGYKFSGQDQDILNSALYPNIKTLAPKYNVMTKYPMTIDGYDTSDALKACFTKEEWTEALTNPVVIHYADVKKPWMYTESPFAKDWWEVFNIASENIQDKSLWAEDLLIFFKLTQNRHIINEDKALRSVSLRDEKIKNLNSEVSNKNESIDNLKTTNESLTQNVTSLEKEVSGFKSDIQDLKRALENQKNENNLTIKNLTETSDKLEKTSNKLDLLKTENKKLKKNIKDIKNSFSFKLGRVITYVPRKLKRIIRSSGKKSK